MFDGPQLIGFAAAVVLLLVVPGPSTILILAHSLSGGRKAGLATVLGVETGTLLHTGAAALGLSTVLSTSASAFNLTKVLGASYLVLLGLKALRGGEQVAQPGRSLEPLRLREAYGRAVITNALNPKTALFFLALLPQFVRPERGHPLAQFLSLGLMVSALGLCYGTILAIAAGAFNGWLKRNEIARRQARLTGAILIALGLQLALAQRN